MSRVLGSRLMSGLLPPASVQTRSFGTGVDTHTHTLQICVELRHRFPDANVWFLHVWSVLALQYLFEGSAMVKTQSSTLIETIVYNILAAFSTCCLGVDAFHLPMAVL